MTPTTLLRAAELCTDPAAKGCCVSAIYHPKTDHRHKHQQYHEDQQAKTYDPVLVARAFGIFFAIGHTDAPPKFAARPPSTSSKEKIKNKYRIENPYMRLAQAVPSPRQTATAKPKNASPRTAEAMP